MFPRFSLFPEGVVSWRDSHHGFEHWRGRLSVGAAFCEWILTLLVIAFTLTFVAEFQVRIFVCIKYFYFICFFFYTTSSEKKTGKIQSNR
jgi:hypothetical protein